MVLPYITSLTIAIWIITAFLSDCVAYFVNGFNTLGAVVNFVELGT